MTFRINFHPYNMNGISSDLSYSSNGISTFKIHTQMIGYRYLTYLSLHGFSLSSNHNKYIALLYMRKIKSISDNVEKENKNEEIVYYQCNLL
jgi:hypothetical protein